VTGATRGIGRAIAQRLADEGWHVVGTGRRSVSDFPGMLLNVDFADDDSFDALLDRLADIGDFAALVNNAAVNIPETLLKVRPESWRAVLQVDLWRPLQLGQALVPAMKANGHGRIVNIGSRGVRGVPGYSSYGGAKGGLEAMGRTWAKELARHGITVNTVAPGPIDTEMFWEVNPPELERTRSYLASIPMQRLGRPDEIAAAVSYFLSPDAAFTTGQTLFVCGGTSIG
jgi:NAD(P)-dependent dehydrogenase (short-subunit alcohol dehydrogenase family)